MRDIKTVRHAMAMLELIFAIVVMGIVMMSAPMLISTATSTTSVALQQEGINEAASRISMIMTYAWDENDTNDSCIPPVLHVTNGDGALDEDNNTARRIGVPLQTQSRTFKCGSIELNASAIGSDEGDLDDIDDFTDTSLVLNGGAASVDYLEQDTIKIATSVSYVADTADYNSQSPSYIPGTASVGTTNIKQIDVTLTSTSSTEEFQKTIKLRAFSCNIGGYEYAKREIQ